MRRIRIHSSKNPLATALAGLASIIILLPTLGVASLAAPAPPSPPIKYTEPSKPSPPPTPDKDTNGGRKPQRAGYNGDSSDNKLGVEAEERWREKHRGSSERGSAKRPGPRKQPPPTVRTIWQRPEGGVGYECGKPGAGQWSCTVPKNSCEAAYVPPLHGQGEDTLLINQPHQAGTADPNKITQRGTRITLADGTRTDLGHRCITLGSPGTAAIPGAPPVVITVTREDFATLPVKPLEATAGPPDGWLPVNMVNVLHTDPTEQTLTTTLLGTPVQIRAIPIEYHWDLGDGNTITTTKPGKPFPSEEVTSTYRYEGWYDITLTTTFAGQFSVNGGPWQDIDGTITITSDPVPLYSASLTSRLTNPHTPTTTDDKHTPDIPARTPETEGPTDPDATHRTI